MTAARRARDGRGRGRRGAGGGLRRRRHGRVHRRPGRALLLHGDEHAPAGRASGHRDDHRAATWSNGSCASPPASRCRCTQDAARDPRPRHRGAPLRRGPDARLPAVDRHAARTCAAGRIARTCASTPASSRATTITPYYDPMIAKLIVWDADRASRARAHAAGAGAVPHRRRRQQRRVPRAPRAPARPSRTADLDTGLIERKRAFLFPAPRRRAGRRRTCVAALADAAARGSAGARRADAPAAIPTRPGALRRLAPQRARRSDSSCSAAASASTRSSSRYARRRATSSNSAARAYRRAASSAPNGTLRVELAGLRARRQRGRRTARSATCSSTARSYQLALRRSAASRRRRRRARRAASPRRCRARSSPCSRSGREGRQGHAAAHPGSDEDGAHHPAPGARHGRTRSTTRVGEQVTRAPSWSSSTRGEGMTTALPRAGDASSKSARATACRTRRQTLPTAVKIELIDRLADAGLPAIEAAASCRRSGCRRWPTTPRCMAGIRAQARRVAIRCWCRT